MEKVKFTERGTELTAALSGELDHYLAASVREKIDVQISKTRPSRFVLDVSGVSFMDSSGLGLIMGRYTVCRRYGASFRLRGADGRAMKILELAGLDGVIQTDPPAEGGKKDEEQTGE